MSKTEELVEPSSQPEKTARSLPESGQAGHYLKTVREKKGLEIETVAEATKISVANIRAIEAQHYERLPAEIFTRGLVSLYAEFLQLEGKQIADSFMQGRSDSLATPRSAKQKNAPQIPTPKRFAEPSHFPPAAIAGIILLLLTLLLAFFYRYTAWNPFRSSAPAIEQQPHPTAPELHENGTENGNNGNGNGPANSALPVPPGVAPVAEAEVAPGSPPGSAQPESSLPLAPPPPPSEQAADAAPGAESSPEPAPEAAAEPSVEPLASPKIEAQATPPYTLAILFVKDTLVEEARDNNATGRYFFKKGEKRIVRAAKAMKLIFAQPASATLQLNGRDIAFPRATAGTAATLMIPENVATP